MSILIFGVVLGVLIVVHEFGHFIVAKLVGVRVEKFSIGFGPVVLSMRGKETEFCVSLLPLGGFVKLAGEDPQNAKGESWEFNSKPLAAKAAVVLAGPLMNALLALALFFVIFCVGQPMLTAKIGKVLADTPGHAAGLQTDDRIVFVNGQRVTYWDDVLAEVRKSKDSLVFHVRREDGSERDLIVRPQLKESKDLTGKKTVTPFVGVAPAQEIRYVKSEPLKALGMAFDRLVTMTTMILVSLGMMFTGAMSFKDSMTGPIGIFFMTQQAADLGALYLLYFMGSLSVSLFVLNLLPIPVLDGGHLLFVLIETLKGSPIKESVKERSTQVGMVLLLGLMAFVIFQDVHRFALLDNLLGLFKR